MADAASLGAPNPWHPITDPLKLKILGKLAEELIECGNAVARCIIQGIDEVEPVTGKPNRKWLEDEVADAIANLQIAIEKLNFDGRAIGVRVEMKKRHLSTWHELT